MSLLIEKSNTEMLCQQDNTNVYQLLVFQKGLCSKVLLHLVTVFLQTRILSRTWRLIYIIDTISLLCGQQFFSVPSNTTDLVIYSGLFGILLPGSYLHLFGYFQYNNLFTFFNFSYIAENSVVLRQLSTYLYCGYNEFWGGAKFVSSSLEIQSNTKKRIMNDDWRIMCLSFTEHIWCPSEALSQGGYSLLKKTIRLIYDKMKIH